MPFEPTSATDQKQQFISEWNRGEIAFSQLCLKYGISRPTGYKWVERYQSFGASGLEERSHEAKSHPNALDPKLEELLLRARDRHPSWGPKKLIAWIKQKEGLERVCALSTATEVLKRHGLISTRKPPRRAIPSSEPLAAYNDVNAVWCVDYKGWFRLGNGRRCDPLTLRIYSEMEAKFEAAKRDPALTAPPSHATPLSEASVYQTVEKVADR